MIKLFIYRKSDGCFLYESVGSVDGVVKDIADNQDFTLEPLPNYSQQWYWYDNQWNNKPRI